MRLQKALVAKMRRPRFKKSWNAQYYARSHDFWSGPRRATWASRAVFANVKLNRLLAEQLPIDEIFIFPAMGDEGMPAGGALCYLLQRDGLSHWLSQRHRLRDVYFGRDYTNLIDAAMAACPDIRRTKEDPVVGTARRLNAGQLGAIYVGRMEYGPRALGARSILANPSRRETHDLLNKRVARSHRGGRPC